MANYKDLIVWQKTIPVIKSIYSITATFPKEEVFGITNQMRRAAVSIASNIAEGTGRRTSGEYKQFMGIALGSVMELDAQLEIAKELSYISPETHAKISEPLIEISKMLYKLSHP